MNSDASRHASLSIGWDDGSAGNQQRRVSRPDCPRQVIHAMHLPGRAPWRDDNMVDAVRQQIVLYDIVGIAQPADRMINTLQHIPQGRTTHARRREEPAPQRQGVVRDLFGETGILGQWKDRRVADKGHTRSRVTGSQRLDDRKRQQAVADSTWAHNEQMSHYFLARNRISSTTTAARLTSAVKIFQLWRTSRSKLSTATNVNNIPSRKDWRIVVRYARFASTTRLIAYATGVSVLVSATSRIIKNATNDRAVPGATKRVNSTSALHAVRARSSRKESDERAVIVLPHQVEALVIAQGRFAAATALLGIATEVALPDIRRILALAAVLRITGAHAADDRRIDSCTRDDHLTLGERRQVF